ncbi:semaphorin-5A-like [Ruditapes philippinarum]|uniref:semaphorin-5A-like n=1 Tax=Ruditapes philippinarum TaxID=129788 RepID=UPI00295BB938|nr:semaphorin-5A-like [Ruditapes philippinarum]
MLLQYYITVLTYFGVLDFMNADPTCFDSEKNCALWDSIFKICKMPDNAKKVCQKFCELCDAVDGSWTVWSSWMGCDATCENGTRGRLRTCSHPKPSFGGNDFYGDAYELEPCKVPKLCPVHGGWQTWQDWSACSTSCGVGMQSRYRNCSNPVPDRQGNHCFGNSLEDRLCYPGLCANVWSKWQPWDACSDSCKGGIRTRSRICSNPSPFTAEGDCPGNSTEIKTCDDKLCFSDCYEIHQKQNKSQSGIYNITLWKTKQTIQMKCDMDTDKGGWT